MTRPAFSIVAQHDRPFGRSVHGCRRVKAGSVTIHQQSRPSGSFRKGVFLFRRLPQGDTERSPCNPPSNWIDSPSRFACAARAPGGVARACATSVRPQTHAVIGGRPAVVLDRAGRARRVHRPERRRQVDDAEDARGHSASRTRARCACSGSCRRGERRRARVSHRHGVRPALAAVVPAAAARHVRAARARLRDRRGAAPPADRRADVALFELGALVDTPVRQLSLGERMRCEIAASLLHAPRTAVSRRADDRPRRRRRRRRSASCCAPSRSARA